MSHVDPSTSITLLSSSFRLLMHIEMPPVLLLEGAKLILQMANIDCGYRIEVHHTRRASTLCGTISNLSQAWLPRALIAVDMNLTASIAVTSYILAGREGGMVMSRHGRPQRTSHTRQSQPLKTFTGSVIIPLSYVREAYPCASSTATES